MLTSASDQELLARQEALQAEAAQVLAELDLGQLFADVGRCWWWAATCPG